MQLRYMLICKQQAASVSSYCFAIDMGIKWKADFSLFHFFWGISSAIKNGVLLNKTKIKSPKATIR